MNKKSTLKENLIRLLGNAFLLEEIQNKNYFSQLLSQKLTSAGFHVEKELDMSSLDMGCSGRVNYVVTNDVGDRCVIELDNRSPRGRSLAKIDLLPAEIEGFILLRDGKVRNRQKVCGVDIVTAWGA